MVDCEPGPLPARAVARDRVDHEHLRAMEELWTNAEPAFEGKYTQFGALKFEPKPLQRPHPPIWVVGHSRATLRRTVAVGVAWHPINRPPSELRAGRAELGAGPRRPGGPLRRRSRSAMTRVLQPGQATPPSAHGGRVLAGEPGALIDQIRELAECGVEHLVLEFLSEDGRALEEQMQVFASEVQPAFA